MVKASDTLLHSSPYFREKQTRDIYEVCVMEVIVSFPTLRYVKYLSVVFHAARIRAWQTVTDVSSTALQPPN